MRAINLKPSSKVTGNSKFGGNPLMPASMEWPTSWKSAYPMHFLCQIDLSEFDNDFAETGILYFFIVNDDPDEINPTSDVLYYDGTEKLEERHMDDAMLKRAQDTTNVDYPFKEVGLELDEDEEGNTHLFGSGDYIQGDLEDEEDEEDEKENEEENEDEDSSKRMLLFQIDSYDFNQMGSYGSIYYFIMSKEELEKKDFSHCDCFNQYD